MVNCVSSPSLNPLLFCYRWRVAAHCSCSIRRCFTIHFFPWSSMFSFVHIDGSLFWFSFSIFICFISFPFFSFSFLRRTPLCCCCCCCLLFLFVVDFKTLFNADDCVHNNRTRSPRAVLPFCAVSDLWLVGRRRICRTSLQSLPRRCIAIALLSRTVSAQYGWENCPPACDCPD